MEAIQTKLHRGYILLFSHKKSNNSNSSLPNGNAPMLKKKQKTHNCKKEWYKMPMAEKCRYSTHTHEKKKKKKRGGALN